MLSVPYAVPVQCDSGNDQELAALFERIEKEAGRLDVLVNNAFSGVVHMQWPQSHDCGVPRSC